MKRGKLPFLLFFLLDAAYMLTVTVMFTVFRCWRMNADFRLFVLLASCAGLALWHITAGRAVMCFSETIVRFLRTTVYRLIVRPACALCRLLFAAARAAVRPVLGRLICSVRRGMRQMRSAGIRRKFPHDTGLTVQENKRKKT